jgi:hypothetical protein
MESRTRHLILHRHYCLPCEFASWYSFIGDAQCIDVGRAVPSEHVNIHLIYLRFIIYLTTLCVAILLYLTVLSRRSPGGSEKSIKIWSLVTVPTEIVTEHFPNKCEQHYRPNQLSLCRHAVELTNSMKEISPKKPIAAYLLRMIFIVFLNSKISYSFHKNPALFAVLSQTKNNAWIRRCRIKLDTASSMKTDWSTSCRFAFWSIDQATLSRGPRG